MQYSETHLKVHSVLGKSLERKSRKSSAGVGDKVRGAHIFLADTWTAGAPNKQMKWVTMAGLDEAYLLQVP